MSSRAPVLVGAEVNVVRERELWPRSLSGDDLTPGDHRALREHAKVEERRDEEQVDVDADGIPDVYEAPEDIGPAPSRRPRTGPLPPFADS